MYHSCIPEMFFAIKNYFEYRVVSSDKYYTMSTRPKERVVAAFRKFFRSTDKISEQEGPSNSTSSPSRRRLNRHHRPDVVTPATGSIPENPGSSHIDHSNFFKTKKSSGNSVQVRMYRYSKVL